ncbi:unnamed protein product, partial [Rotaria sp. Silwood1]
GNISFANQVTYSTGLSSFPYSIAVHDFNNDSRLDIVVANYGSNNVGIFLGYGNGSFTNQTTYPTGSNSDPYSVAVDDFNNDTIPDIVVANHGTNNLGVFLGYGNGAFAIYTSIPDPLVISGDTIQKLAIDRIKSLITHILHLLFYVQYGLDEKGILDSFLLSPFTYRQ